MRIVWLAANVSHSHSSLALPALHTACRGVPDVMWDCVQVTTRESAAETAVRVASLEPEVVASTLYLFNRTWVLDCLSRVRVLCPDVRIIGGGPECLGDADPLLAPGGPFDALCRGDGESGLPLWLSALTRDTPGEGIPGLCFRAVDGCVMYPDAPAVSAVLPDLRAVAADPFLAVDGPSVQIETSRGCAGRCTFCTSASVPVRMAGMEAVRAALETLRGRGVTSVRLIDRTFNAVPARAVSLLALFRSGFPDMTFHLELHPGLLGDRVREALAQAPEGQLQVEVGIQSLTPSVRDAIGRQGRPDRDLDGLTFLAELGTMVVHADLLAGLPGQTLQHLLDDVRAVMSAAPTEIQLEVVKALPGTEFADTASRHGIRVAPSAPYDVLETPDMSMSDVVAAGCLARFLDVFHNDDVFQGALVGTVARTPESLESLPGLADEAGVLGEASLSRRMRWLRGALGGDQVAREAVEVAWMVAGLSPGHGIAPAEPWSRNLPDDADWVRGSAEIDPRRARIWHVRQPSADWWFVYAKGKGGRRPCAVLRRGRGSAPPTVRQPGCPPP